MSEGKSGPVETGLTEPADTALHLVCNWVLVLVRMPHPLAAACQDVPSFVRWPIVCVCV